MDVDEPDAGLATTIVIGDETAGTAGDPGPRSLDELADEVRSIARYDGVRMQAGRARRHAFRDPAVRIAGHAEASVRVVRRR